jgi:hypothetical protein
MEPLVPRWLLIIADINLLVLLCFLIHRDVIASLWSSGDFHLSHGDMDIPMGSLVAVEPSGMGLPSMLKNQKPFRAEPSYRASASGALSIIASRGLSTPRSSRDITSSSKQL